MLTKYLLWLARRDEGCQIAAVRSGLRLALDSLDRVIIALQTNAERSRDNTGLLLGSESGCDGVEREPADEQALRRAEADLIAYSKRLARLRNARGMLAAMIRMIEPSLFGTSGEDAIWSVPE